MARKETSGNKIAFTWCFLTAAMIMYLPVCLAFWPQQSISKLGWACIVGTGIFHFLYFWFMAGSYERGDLSLVYPLFRYFSFFLNRSLMGRRVQNYNYQICEKELAMRSIDS